MRSVILSQKVFVCILQICTRRIRPRGGCVVSPRTGARTGIKDKDATALPLEEGQDLEWSRFR